MNAIISEKIKRFRKAKGLSQEEVAERLHISQSAYARIETGESQSWATHLTKLSEIFEVKPESFLSDEANNFNNQNHELNGGMAFQFVGTINTINSLSEKLIEQYEERIQELKAEVQSLKTELSSLKNSLPKLLLKNVRMFMQKHTDVFLKTYASFKQKTRIFLRSLSAELKKGVFPLLQISQLIYI